jgi:hypothetical protein
VCDGLKIAKLCFRADSFGPRIRVFTVVSLSIRGVLVQFLDDFTSDLNSASSTAAP